jgi:Putative beta-barrel porin-2, OmpL-like. bbp2
MPRALLVWSRRLSLSAALMTAVTAAPAVAQDGPAAAPTPQPSPDPSPAAGGAAPTPLEVTAFADVYYGWHFNKTDAALRNFDVNHDTFSINLVEVALEKKSSTASRVGFRADLDFGPAADTVASLEPGGSGEEIFKHLQQGYVGVLAGSKLQLDFGKFVTPHGAEVIESKDNWNYSRSLLFALAIPYYHVGFRASMPVSDKVSLAGFAVNGWNNGTENNTGKTFGLGASVKPNGKLTWVGNYMTGPEQADDNQDKRHLFDTTVTLTATPKLSLMANYDYGKDTVAGSPVTWQGVALYARYEVTGFWAVAPRYEWVDDEDAFMTGTRQTLQEFTLTSEFKIAKSLITRLEYRRDFSDAVFFPTDTGSKKKSQTSLTVGVLYAFGGKI